MAFKPGHKKVGGRKKGVQNAKTREFMTMLQDNDFDPGEAQIRCFNEAMQIYNKRKEHKMYATAFKSLSLAAQIANDISQFAYPKKKAIEHSGELGIKTFADFMADAEKKKPEDAK